MAVREIKTRLAMDGEQAFNRAIKEVDRNLRTMQSQLKAASSEFELTGDKQKLLTTRSQLFEDSIKQQEEKIKALKDALKTAAGTYGEVDARTDRYRIKINEATAELNKMRKQLEETDREAEELGRDSTRVGRQLENGIGDAAKDASRALDDAIEEMNRGIGNIEIAATVSVAATGIGAIKDAIGSINELADSTREDRRQQAFFEFNAQEAGYSEEFIKKQRLDIASITGDLEGAYETLNNLMLIGFSESEIERAIDGLLTKAVATGNATLQMQSLADSLQETIEGGTATGAFEEMLVRDGKNVEDFNKQLEKSTTRAGDLRIALGYLSEGDTGGIIEKFKAYNEELIKATQAEIALKDAMADLGETIEPITTAIKLKIAETLTDVAYLVDSVLDWLEKGGFSYTFDRNGDAKGEAYDKQLEMYKILGEEEAAKEYEGYIKQRNAYKAQLSEINAQFINAHLDGNIPLYEELTEQREGIITKLEELEDLMNTGGEEAGEAIMTGLGDALTRHGATRALDAKAIGGNLITALGNGISKEAAYAINQTTELVNDMLAELSRLHDTDISGSLKLLSNGTGKVVKETGKSSAGGSETGGLSTQKTINVALNVDGRTFARATAPYINEVMGGMA